MRKILGDNRQATLKTFVEPSVEQSVEPLVEPFLEPPFETLWSLHGVFHVRLIMDD